MCAKTAVCSIHPAFRGSSCGLSEKFCSRNDCPIPLARAKPGRGRQYGAGQLGGAQRPGRCLFLGCTPRSPTGVRGPQPPARFRHFSAVKSAPLEEDKPDALAHLQRLGPPAAGAGRYNPSVSLRETAPLTQGSLWHDTQAGASPAPTCDSTVGAAISRPRVWRFPRAGSKRSGPRFSP